MQSQMNALSQQIEEERKQFQQQLDAERQQFEIDRKNWSTERAELLLSVQKVIDERQTLLTENQQYKSTSHGSSSADDNNGARAGTRRRGEPILISPKIKRYNPKKVTNTVDSSTPMDYDAGSSFMHPIVPPEAHSTPTADANSASAAPTSGSTNSSSDTSNLADNASNLDWTTVSTKTQRKTPRPKGDAKTTPIQLQVLESDRIRLLGVELAGKIGKDEVYISRISDNQQARIICANEAAKKTATDHLIANKIQFNSYNNSDTRRKAFIVRGLFGADDDDAIQMIASALEGIGIDTAYEISRFITPYQRHHPVANRTPLYRVTVLSSVDDQLLLNIRTIGYCGVRVEKMKKSAVVQCRNCQRLNHTANQCKFDYRCVQCATVHVYGHCPRAVNPAMPVGCINCRDDSLPHLEHTANDLVNCNFYKKIVANQQQQQQRDQPQRSGQQRNEASRVNSGTVRSALAGRVSVKPKNIPGPAQPSGSPPSTFASIVRGGVAGFDAEQLANLISLTVKNVLTALAHGS